MFPKYFKKHFTCKHTNKRTIVPLIITIAYLDGKLALNFYSTALIDLQLISQVKQSYYIVLMIIVEVFFLMSTCFRNTLYI